jgi:hypothetical protein
MVVKQPRNCSDNIGGHGFEAHVNALVATTVLYAVDEAARKVGADSRSALDAAVNYLRKLNLLWLLEHRQAGGNNYCGTSGCSAAAGRDASTLRREASRRASFRLV